MPDRFRFDHQRSEKVLAALAVWVCAAFALRTLSLIDSSSLWADELRSVIKSFQPSPGFVLSYLRTDVHPPLYYLGLWGWGQLVGQTATSLRLFSWPAYILAGALISLQAACLARRSARAACLAALLAFCTPFPVRFSIEGKGYALLVALTALALLLRRLALQRQGGVPLLCSYAGAVALSGLTHFYGLGLMGAITLADMLRRRWQLALAATAGLLPGVGWVALASAHLLAPNTNDWISPPEFSLLTDVLTGAVGGRPYETLGFTMAALSVLMIGSRLAQSVPSSPAGNFAGVEGEPTWLQVADRSGLWGGLILVVLVVAVSFLRPIAVPRYFFVLVPAVMPALAALAADWALPPRAQWVALLFVVLGVLHCWEASFAALERFDRQGNDFRSLSLRFSLEANRYASRPELFETSDRMLIASGTLKGTLPPWWGEDDLRHDLGSSEPSSHFALVTVGGPYGAERFLKNLKSIANQAGYECSRLGDLPRGAHAWRCSKTP